jgi:phosphonate transport system substrate-binding protein
VLRRAGLKPSDFHEIQNLKTHDAVAKSVLQRKVNAGAVKDVVAERFARNGLRVLAYSEPIPSVPLVVHRTLSGDVVGAVVKALLRLNYRNPADRELMSQWDDEFRHGFAEVRSDDYEDVSRMFKAIPYGCGTGCH